MVPLYVVFPLLWFCLPFGTCRIIGVERMKRNVFDPPLPVFPNSNTPFFQPAPFPLPVSTPSPAEALLPHPPKYASDNPYLDVITEPINPNYGMGFSAVQPTLLGGSINFPTGNLLRPQETVGGTFGFSRPLNVRFGNQGGPFFPWQDPKFAKTIKSINEANNIVKRDTPTSDRTYYYVDQPTSNSNPSQVKLFNLPPLPANYDRNSQQLFDLPPLPTNYNNNLQQVHLFDLPPLTQQANSNPAQMYPFVIPPALPPGLGFNGR